MSRDFINKIMFMSPKEAQKHLDASYPGYTIKCNKMRTVIYNAVGGLVIRIQHNAA